jgi:hypothetical protein
MRAPIIAKGTVRRAAGALAAGLAILLAAQGVVADDAVARWIDADGVTHFSDRQFAPAHADVQRIESANGMTTPLGNDTGVRRADGPVWTLISLPPKHNPNGWRSKGEGPRSGPISQSGR